MPRETQKVGQRRSRIVLVKTLRSSMARLVPSAVRVACAGAGDSGSRAVVSHEDLFKARFDRPHVGDLEARRGLDQSIQAALDRALEDTVVHADVDDPRKAAECLG